MGFQVYASAYRGYTPNSGWTTESVLVPDSQDLLDYAIKDAAEKCSRSGRSLPTKKVFVFGWSMGAAVALQLALARSESIAGLVLMCPWTSLREETLTFLAPTTYALLPWIWLADSWESKYTISSLPLDIPVAVMSALEDEVIAPSQHRAVFEASQAQQKWWLPVVGAYHNS